MNTPWMDFMNLHKGEHETGSNGNSSNPFIVALFQHTTFKANSDQVPWCSACVCTALETTGYASTHRADAISYTDYGIPCDLQYGCVVVLKHPNGQHHVTFCDQIEETTFTALGGNQNNSICDKIYNQSEIISTRWPISNDNTKN